MTLVDGELLGLLTPDEIEQLTDAELDAVLQMLTEAFEAPDRPGLLPHQVPPDDWQRIWVLLGGRGAGKTQGASVATDDHVHGPPCSLAVPGGHRPVIIGPTLGDAIDACVLGPSGLRALDPTVRVTTRTGGTYVRWGNGVEGRILGGYSKQDAERLRATTNHCFAWVEELAAIRQLQAVFTQMRLGLRLGPSPKVVASTTPRARAVFRRILADKRTVVTHGVTDDNPHLDPDLKAEFHETFEGTSVERQELYGELLTDVVGALWTQDVIDETRMLTAEIEAGCPRHDGETREAWLRRALGLTTILLCIDPATSGRGDETGLVVVGADSPRKYPDGRRHAYILEDRTKLLLPHEWAEQAAEIAYRWQVDAMLLERNRIGEMGKLTIEGAGFHGRVIDFDVPAGQSKSARANPVRAAWHRCHIVGSLPKLEGQMTQWVPAEGDDPSEIDPENPDAFTGSPDALDPMAHGVRRLFGLGKVPKRRGRSRAYTSHLA